MVTERATANSHDKGGEMVPHILDNALGFNLYRVNLLFRRELMQALACYKMTPEQWQILTILWSRGVPANQRDIVQDTLKDKYTVSRILQRLERDGWVTKTVNSHDKRITEIQLTDKGRSSRSKVTRMLREHFETVLTEFSQDEHETLLPILKKLRKILGDE